MATHPMVLLVEPDDILRQLIRGELKDEGCVVYDAATSDDALAFAERYPGPIDLAVTDFDRSEHSVHFARALRALPTGMDAKVSQLPGLFDRTDFVRSMRRMLPTGVDARQEQGDRAVFWGARHHEQAELRPAS